MDDNKNIHEDYRQVLQAKKAKPSCNAMDEFFGEPQQRRVRKSDVQIQVESALQGEQGLQMVKQAIEEEYPYSLAFVDIRMPPGWDGLKTVSEFWKVAPDLQIVICSAYSDKSYREICRDLGHNDSLLILKKPFDADEVFQIAVAMTEKWRLGRQARLRQEDLERLVQERTQELVRASLEDPLTGLANRKKFNARLDIAVKRARRYNTLTGLMLIDVDFFKEVNDTLGHPAGDQLLVEIARRLERILRDTDTVARLGGDEFAIIQTEVSTLNAFRIVLDRIEHSLAEPFLLDDKPIDCQFSIGVAVAPHDGDCKEQLMKRADIALYRSKNNGRARTSFYEPEMDRELAKLRQIKLELAQGLKNREFQLFFQPIFSCEKGHLVALEALLRWNHPRLGLLTPGSFLPAAEESGLIIDIGRWVVAEATRIATTWPEHIMVAVNLSPSQFHPRHKICETVLESLQNSGLPAERLEIEITEHVLLNDFDVASETISRLRQAGVSLALDDFGVGHSSLNYLQVFPFDKLKLDQSFVRLATECDKSRAIMNSVAALGRELGIAVSAEGIETQEQLDLVTRAGFTELQGYLFGKPVANPDLHSQKQIPPVPLITIDPTTTFQSNSFSD